MIRVYDDAGNVIETHEHKGEHKMYNAEKKEQHATAAEQSSVSGCGHFQHFGGRIAMVHMTKPVTKMI